MSQLNRNAAYIYDVDGDTVWERLRCVRTFLQDREKSLKLAELSLSELLEKIETGKGYEKAKNEIEADYYKPLMQDCINEISFLKKMEAVLLKEAEKTRLPGKTDEEMYEINFFHEHTTRIVNEAIAEVACTNSVSPMTMKRMLRNREALKACIAKGILNENVLEFISPCEPVKVIEEGKINGLLDY